MNKYYGKKIQEVSGINKIYKLVINGYYEI